MAGKKAVTSPANVRFKITEEKKLGKNAEIVCDANKDLIDEIKKCITSSESVIGVMHRNKKNTGKNPDAYIGVNADSVNDIIREKLKVIDNLRFETHVEYGAFFERNIKSNFDFSFYDRMLNYCSFWNYNNKSSALNKIIEETIQDRDRADWEEFNKKYKPKPLVDVEFAGKHESTIVGEIQMGNWAMIYKDIIRLIRAKDSPGVDLYIYITNTGLLKQKLSDGIVSYDKAVVELQENMDVINTPILVLGIDIEKYDQDEFEAAHSDVQKTKVSKMI